TNAAACLLGFLALVTSLAFMGTVSATPDRQAPNAPRLELVSQIGGKTKAIQLDGTLAYLGIGPRLVIFDVSDASVPTRLGQTEVLPDVVRSIQVANGFAFAALGRGGVWVIDVREPR